MNWQELANKFVNTMERSKKYVDSFLAGMITGVGSVITMASLIEGEVLGAIIVLGGIVLAVLVLITSD